jgi:hypothetical protein
LPVQSGNLYSEKKVVARPSIAVRFRLPCYGTIIKTSRCPYCAFGFHCKFTGMWSCQIMSLMSNHVIHVKLCHSCQIMSFMSNHVIDVKSCHSCQIMSFMSNHVIHVKSCHSCQIMSFLSNHVIHVSHLGNETMTAITKLNMNSLFCWS